MSLLIPVLVLCLRVFIYCARVKWWEVWLLQFFTAPFLLLWLRILCFIRYAFVAFSCALRQPSGHDADLFPPVCGCCTCPNHHSKYLLLLCDWAISFSGGYQPTHMDGISQKPTGPIGMTSAELEIGGAVFRDICVFARLHVPTVIIVDLPGHMVNNRGEVGGSVETHRFETLVIGLHHPLDPTAVRILWITVLRKNRKTKDNYLNVHVKLQDHSQIIQGATQRWHCNLLKTLGCLSFLRYACKKVGLDLCLKTMTRYPRYHKLFPFWPCSHGSMRRARPVRTSWHYTAFHERSSHTSPVMRYSRYTIERAFTFFLWWVNNFFFFFFKFSWLY